MIEHLQRPRPSEKYQATITMPIATQTSTIAPTTTADKVLKLRATGTQEPDHIRQLRENGFAVVPKVLTEDKAGEYVQRANAWLEDFGRGFKADDKETW